MFLDELKKHWNKRTTIRFLVFTYPKTSGLGFCVFLAGFGLVLKNELDKTNSLWNGVRDSMHSGDKTTRRNNRMVIYEGSIKD